MIRALALPVVAVLVVACGSPRASATSPSPPALASQPAATPAPMSPDAASAARSTPPKLSSCTAPPPNAVQVLSLVFAQDDVETVHLLTVDGGAITDCLLFDRQPIRIWDAAKGRVLLSTNDGTLWTLDLQTNSLRNVGYSRGDLFGPVLSPDGTEAAVETGQPGTGFDIDIVELASGSSRPVLHVGPNDFNRSGLRPLRWLTGAIIVTQGVWECGSAALFALDPSSGSLTHVADGAVGALSSGGTSWAYSDYANLGDRPYEGMCGWHNQLHAGTVGGQTTLVRSEQNHDFLPLDVRDDGSVLYSSDEGPGETAPPTADMGLYLYSNGVTVKQYGEAHSAYWTSAIFVGPDTAIASESLSFSQYGSVEVILVSLCRVSACVPSARAIDNPTGPYPTVSFLRIRP